jgi:predicted transcriptional regulator
MRNNPINKKKLYINYLLLMFFHGLNFTHIRYKAIILSCFTHNSMLNTKNTIIKLNSNFMNNLSSTNNNYYNNSNKFIILKGNSYTQKNLIKIYKKINQILKQELFLMIITYNKILKKLFQIKMKINKINFIVQRKMFSKIQ